MGLFYPYLLQDWTVNAMFGIKTYSLFITACSASEMTNKNVFWLFFFLNKECEESADSSAADSDADSVADSTLYY